MRKTSGADMTSSILSEKEISDYQETKDHTPYLPKNEDIAMPVGYKELSPEPYKSWREVTKDNPEESFPVGWSDNPFYLAQSIDTEPLETELRRSIEPGNEIPGAALISLPTEDGEDFTAHVPGEAVRDALQLQGVDTNKIIKDIAAEGFIGQKDEDIAQVPEGINKKGADPIAEGWTSSDWLNEDGSTEFHDLIKANEDFTRLAGFYNDAKIDSPLMSDYQEKDMLGNLGIDATDEINAIDKGLKFEAGPSAKVGYALNLLDNPDFSSNPDFKKDANGNLFPFTAPPEFTVCPPVLESHSGTGEDVAMIDIAENADGISVCGINNPKIGIAVAMKFSKKQLPWLTNWQHYGRGEYVTGIEPGTHPPIGQSKTREEKTLIFIEPGETRNYALELEVLNNPEKINQFLQESTITK